MSARNGTRPRSPKCLMVTRHAGAVEWLQRHPRWTQGRWPRAELVSHLSLEASDRLRPGDRVVGTLPVNLAASVCQQGAAYWHLGFSRMPADARGAELTADDMDAYGATLRRYVVWMHGVPQPRGAS